MKKYSTLIVQLEWVRDGHNPSLLSADGAVIIYYSQTETDCSIGLILISIPHQSWEKSIKQLAC